MLATAKFCALRRRLVSRPPPVTSIVGWSAPDTRLCSASVNRRTRLARMPLLTEATEPRRAAGAPRRLG